MSRYKYISEREIITQFTWRLEVGLKSDQGVKNSTETIEDLLK